MTVLKLGAAEITDSSDGVVGSFLLATTFLR
jgi:hypothetical protein